MRSSFLIRVALSVSCLVALSIFSSQSLLAGDQPPALPMDEIFARITSGPIVEAFGISCSGDWGDYDGDGDLDLFVAKLGYESPRNTDALFRNDGDGTFTRIIEGSLVNDAGDSGSAAWADYDNDGDLDLYVSNDGGDNEPGQMNFLYRNDGGGCFTSIAAAVVTRIANSVGCAWADYDGDGFLDLFVANRKDQNDSLYRNRGDGDFEEVLSGPVVTDGGQSFGCAWGDYDNDGDADLFVANAFGATNRLYQNDGDGAFTLVMDGIVVSDPADANAAAWGDYDNDGDLDLFVTNWEILSFLYRNEGAGTFTKITEGKIVNTPSRATAAAWGDYDNDGHLDLFVANNEEPSFLYRNGGDGTFTQVLERGAVEGSPRTCGAAWGDYDGDGFLDLFLANGAGFEGDAPSALYRNRGNGNAWIHFRLAGTVSNRSAIGAKVRVRAVIGGEARWQMREISSGGGALGGDSLDAEFGLGDATKVDIVRIEWPSGSTQQIENVAVRQLLRVTEPLPEPVSFLRGDCNDDGSVDISDPLSSLGVLFVGQGEITCQDACDSNDDGTVDISDAIATLGVLFLGNGVIPLPGMTDCGVDPTDDQVGCDTFERCP